MSRIATNLKCYNGKNVYFLTVQSLMYTTVVENAILE